MNILHYGMYVLLICIYYGTNLSISGIFSSLRRLGRQAIATLKSSSRRLQVVFTKTNVFWDVWLMFNVIMHDLVREFAGFTISCFSFLMNLVSTSFHVHQYICATNNVISTHLEFLTNQNCSVATSLIPPREKMGAEPTVIHTNFC